LGLLRHNLLRVAWLLESRLRLESRLGLESWLLRISLLRIARLGLLIHRLRLAITRLRLLVHRLGLAITRLGHRLSHRLLIATVVSGELDDDV